MIIFIIIIIIMIVLSDCMNNTLKMIAIATPKKVPEPSWYLH